MKFQTIFTTIAALAMAVAPAIALPEPEAIPELDNELESRAQCRPGHHLVGAGCAPSTKGHTSCSADDRSVIICTGSGPTWQIQNRCQRGSCNNNCVCT